MTLLLAKAKKCSHKPISDYSVNTHAAVFLIATLIIIILPGPTYYAGFLFFLLFFSRLLHKQLSIAAFHLYLLTLFIGQPILVLKETTLQDFTFFEAPTLLSLPVEIPIRFIIFLIFLFSLLDFEKKRIQTKYRQDIYLSLPLLSICLIVLILVIAQIVANYPLKYTWPFFHFVQIFLVFPATLVFLQQNKYQKRRISLITRMLMGFAVSALIIQGVIASTQFINKSPTNIRVEAPFKVSEVSAPEDNLFRSSGTFGHPNFLGVNIALLLPFTLLSWINLATKKGRKNTNSRKVIKTATILGLTTLLLSFSRWAWISFILGILLVVVLKQEIIWQLRDLTRKATLPNIIILALVFIVSFVLITKRIKTIETIEVRLGILKVAVQQINRNPLWGIGPGNSALDLSPYRTSFAEYSLSLKGVHNTFLLIGIESGLISLAIFIIFILALTSLVIRYKQEIVANIFKLSLAISLLTFLFNSQAYPLYIWDPSLEIFFLLAAFLAVLLQPQPLKKLHAI